MSSWGTSNPYSDYCLSTQLWNSNDREAIKLHSIIKNSTIVFGVDIRARNLDGSLKKIAIRNSSAKYYKLADSSQYRDPSHPNYLTCNNIENVLVISSDAAASMGTMNNAGCGNLEWTCQCNSRWNMKAHLGIYDRLEAALIYANESENLENCITLNAQVVAKELQVFVEGLWAKSIDVKADNKRLVFSLIGVSMFFVGALLLTTKKR
tara:strand:- start:12073 stop:12696 length:624 start_codon:yes stop_codon:yes gene_type:complete